MNLNDKQHKFTRIEQNNADELVRCLDPKNARLSKNISFREISDKNYINEFPEQNIQTVKLRRCSFRNVRLHGTAGVLSVFDECTLTDCSITDADFSLASFLDTQIVSDKSETAITSCGFLHTNFSGTKLHNTIFSASNFEDSFFSRCKLSNVTFQHCKFENVIFDDVMVVDSDLSQCGLDFALFRSVMFENVVLPYLAILRSYNGLKSVYLQQEAVSFRFIENEALITSRQFFDQISTIRPYLLDNKDYFSLVNVNLFLGDIQLAYDFLILGIKESLVNRDFRTIKHLCRLASMNCFFTGKQLMVIYDLLRKPMLISQLSPYEYQSYLLVLDELKKLLLDNPFDLPQIAITIYTDIPSYESKVAAEMITEISNFVDSIAPQSYGYLSLRHNSPYFFEIFSSENLNELYRLIALLGAACIGLVPIVLKLENIRNTYLENKNKKIDFALKKQTLSLAIEQKRLENEKLKQEICNLKLDNKLKRAEFYKAAQGKTEGNHSDDSIHKVKALISEQTRRHISSITYSIRTNYPETIELRQGTISKTESD